MNFNTVQTAVSLDPQNIKMRKQLCELTIILKQNEKTIDCYRTLIKLKPDDIDIQAGYGLSLMVNQKFKEALPVMEKVALYYSDSADVQNSYGVVLYENKQFEKAIKVFKHVLDLTPNNEKARYNLAIAQLTNRDKDAALRQYLILKGIESGLARELYKIIYQDKVIFVGNR